MKVTISEPEKMDGTLWEGEALSANWDSEKCEVVIRGDADDEAFGAVMASIAEKHRLTIGIEDSGSTQVIWRGYVGSANFQTFEAEQVECCLTMALDDWYGIFPGFSSFYFC
jgi:hypothetical protein